MAANPCPRDVALERLAAETFDLLVIGGGILGSRVALEAALAGASVALLEAGDFGGATSSASSKLIHGGLRYLQRGDLGLVHEAHLERRALMTRVAPYLVRPLDFLLPVYRGGPHSPSVIRAGMLLYSALSGFRQSRHGMVPAMEATRLVPPLRTEGLRACGIFRDAQTHDARLVLATVTAAARAGAMVLNRARVTGLEVSGGRLTTAFVAATEGAQVVRFRQVVNAAGPWVEHVRRLEDPSCAPFSRLSKGVHVSVPMDEPWAAAVAVPVDRGRVAFAIPWEGVLLLGTTDNEYAGDPGAVAATDQDVDAVFGQAAIALPAAVTSRARLLHRFAGLRVLPAGPGDPAAESREHVISVGPAGMVSVAGGKLTTHRRIAVAALRRLDSRRFVLHEDPLPGAGPAPALPGGVDPEVWAHLVHLYGAEAPAVLRGGPAERIHAGGPDTWAQVRHAAAVEWATTVEDVVRRRTTLEVRGLATAEVRAQIEAALQPTAAARGFK